MKLSKRIGWMCCLILAGLLTTSAFAQNQGGGGQGGQGGGPGGGQGGGRGFGGGGGFDPQQIQQYIQQARQQYMDNIKAALGSSDDEFRVIQPKIQKVMDQTTNSGTTGLQMRAFLRNPQMPPGLAGMLGIQQTPVSTAADDLQKALDDPNAAPEIIKSKLDVLRQAKAKSREDLVAAMEDLKSLLSMRQEAVLVSYGLLE